MIFGKACVVRQGTDVTLIGCGLMVPVVLDAAAILAEEGIQALVLEMHTVKPLDVAAIEAAARKTGAIVTGQEHVRTGGVGSNIALVRRRDVPRADARGSPSPTSSPTPRRPPRSCRTAGSRPKIWRRRRER